MKLYEQLVEEGYTGSYSPVCRFIKVLKADGSQLSQAFIPLHFAAGDALQFDWSEEHVVLGGVDHKIKVAHFRLCHSRKPFVVAYPGEVQEMVLDAFVRALAFYDGVPRRVIIDNPKTMVTYVSRSKMRIFHPRFLALMNHYVILPALYLLSAFFIEQRIKCSFKTGTTRFNSPVTAKRPLLKFEEFVFDVSIMLVNQLRNVA